MSSSHRLGVRFGLIAACCALTACSGVGSLAQAPLAPMAERAARPDGHVHPRVIVTYGGVQVFTTSGLLVQTLYVLSNGIAADVDGTLYVTDDANNQILAYTPPYSAPTATLSDNGEIPIAVAVKTGRGINSGLVAVTAHTSPSDPGSVFFYQKGSTTPCAQISSAPLVFAGDWAAFDKKGNLYVSNGGTTLGLISGGCAATQMVLLTFKVPLTGAYDVQVATDGSVVIAGTSKTRGTGLYIYKPPVKNVFAGPTHILRKVPINDFAFTSDGTAYWTDPYQGSFSGLVEESYPGGGVPLQFFPMQWFPTSIAVTPVEQP